MKLLSWIPVISLLTGLQHTVEAQGTSVAIITDAKFRTTLEPEISRLAADIESDLSTQVIIHGVDVGTATPESIRAYIKDLHRTQGLRGIVLVGDIPAAKYGDFMSSTPFLTDAFYEDLDDECWADPDGNGIYNISLDEDGDGTCEYLLKTWIGEHNRDVWSGRLLPPRSIPLEDRVELLRRYLDRNHLFRAGVISYRRSLIYSENTSSDDSATIVARAEQMFEGSWLYHKQQGDTLIPCQAADPVARKTQWLDAVGDSVEYAFISVHGTPTSQWFGGSVWLYNSDYRQAPVNACVVDLVSCSNGDFSDPDYLAGWVLFGGASLIVKANTAPVMYVGTPRPDPDQRLLSLGQTTGQVRLAEVLSNDAGILFGDPTLRLRSRGTGPVLDHDTSVTVLPTETVQSVPGNYQGGLVRLTNRGDQPLQTFLRIVSLTSINGRRPDVQCSFSLPELKSSFLFDVPLILQPGQSKSTPVTFSYEAASPGDTTGATAFLGTFRARACFYTNSPASPFFWLSFEKTVTPFVPDMPALSAPPNNAVSQPVSLTLMWNRSARATTYHVQLSADPLFGSFVVNDSSVVDTVRRVGGLANNTTYYWRVHAINSRGESAFSAPYAFTTVVGRPDVPVLLAPMNGADSQPISLTLRWNHVIGANGYQVQVSPDSIFMTLVVNDSLLTDTTRLVVKLDNGTRYYWHVRSVNAGGPSPYSDPHTFTTIVAAPSQVKLVKPVHGARVATDNVMLSWRASTPEILSYELEVIGDSTITRATIETTFVITIPAGSGERAYSWRVRAKNMAGYGMFSQAWTFIRLTTDVSGLGGIPVDFVLFQNYANPFNPSTTIRYGLPSRMRVSLSVFNTLGQRVAELVNGEVGAGYHEVKFDASNLSSGMYFYRLQGGNILQTRKLLVDR